MARTMSRGMHVVSVSVCLDTEAIQKRSLGEWIEIFAEDWSGGAWTEVFEMIALSYLAGGDHSEYVIWQENDVKEES